MTNEIIQQALKLIKNQEFETARELIKQLLQAESSNELAWVLLAQTYTNAEDKESIYEQGLECNHDSKLIKEAQARTRNSKREKPSEPGVQVNENIGVNISAGEIRLKNGSVVGRDQIIQNITITSQFLNLAKERLLPKITNPLPIDFSTIHEALQSFVNENESNFLVEATNRAGIMLSPVLETIEVDPNKDTSPVRIEILNHIAQPLGDEFEDMRYWENYSDPFREKKDLELSNTEISKLDKMNTTRVIWLYSTKEIWRKYLQEHRIFGLLQYRNTSESWRYTFIGRSLKIEKHPSFSQGIRARLAGREVSQPGKFAFSSLNPGWTSPNIYGSLFNGFTFDTRRLFLFGLAIDLIRISAQAISDVHNDHQLSSKLRSISEITREQEDVNDDEK